MGNNLKNKIEKKKAVVGVIGLGYVGLPLVRLFLKSGFKVYGFDIDNNKIKKLKRGISYIKHIDFKFFKERFLDGKFFPTTDFKESKNVDIIIICVPTPLDKNKKPDLRYVDSTIKNIKKHLKKGSLVILESTTYPGTTREKILPVLEKEGFKVEKDIFLAFSPEREDPGNKKFNTKNIPKVVGGIGKKSTKLAFALYSKVVDRVVNVSSPEIAEATKMLENTFRAVNIALVNELKIFFDKAGIDIWEVIRASSTKPFGYMPFYPGPGWGGHCLGENEFIFVKNGNGIECRKIKELFEINKKDIFKVKGTEFLKPDGNLKVLSYDIEKKRPVYKKINLISKRRYKRLIEFKTSDGRIIEVTELHPVIIKDENNSFKIRLAKDIKEGDEFVLSRTLPKIRKKISGFDLTKYLKGSKYEEKIRVFPRNFKLELYRNIVKEYLKRHTNGYNYRDYFRGNFVPLKVFYDVRDKIPFDIKKIYLCTGSGRSITKIPAFIEINKDMCRLLGYYLSEGCITEDTTLRTRFTFNRRETEFIEDIRGILDRLDIKYSIYRDKKFDSLTIKISSVIFGFFLKEVLKCGTNSYNMKIPSFIFTLPLSYKVELLKGLFRGDGGVDYITGMRKYRKNNKKYEHFCNSATINYYTISSGMFHQVVFLLQEFGIVPYFKKRKGLLNISGYQQIQKAKDFFIGKKREKLEKYIINNKKIIPGKHFKDYGKFFSVKLKEKKVKRTKYVYSMEVDGTNTFIGSYGFVFHNCIPVDPFYLYWRAKKFGVNLDFIRYAGEINTYMPYYVIEKLENELRKRKKKLKGSKILLLGVAYKRDIDDIRESPALIVFEILEKKGAKVSYYDTYVKKMESKRYRRSVESVKNLEKEVKKVDAVIILTDHTNIDYNTVLKNAKIIIDTRNVFNKIKGEKNKVIKA